MVFVLAQNVLNKNVGLCLGFQMSYHTSRTYHKAVYNDNSVENIGEFLSACD